MLEYLADDWLSIQVTCLRAVGFFQWPVDGAVVADAVVGIIVAYIDIHNLFSTVTFNYEIKWRGDDRLAMSQNDYKHKFI